MDAIWTPRDFRDLDCRIVVIRLATESIRDKTMPTQNLTDRLLRSISAKATKRAEYHDRALPNFGVRVSESGRCSYFVRYRTHRGERRWKTLGTHPILPLADARKLARATLVEVAKGRDPVLEERMRREAETVEDFAQVYLDRYAKIAKRSWKEDHRQLNRDVLPIIGRLPVAEVRRQDLIRIIDRVADRGAGVQANRTAALLSKFFAFARDRGLIEFSPAQALPRAIPETPRDRVLGADEIRKVWGALEPERPSVASSLRLILLTAQRPGEVLGMRRDDLDGMWWTLRSSATKSGRTHRVPISPVAQEVLEVALSASAEKQPAIYVFPSPRGSGPVRWLSHASARVRKRIPDVPHWTPHDLRRTAATHMAQLGVSRFIIGRILNHADPSVTSVYERHDYAAEKAQALGAWGERVGEILAAD